MSKDGVNQEFATWLYDAMQASGFNPEPDRRDAGRTRFAAAADISASTVTRALDNGRVPEPDILRKMAKALTVTTLDAFMAAGYLHPDEVGEPNTDGKHTRPPVAMADVAEAIRRDADLLDEAREHLLNQYALLRRIAPMSVEADSKPPLRAVAEHGDPADRAALSNLAREARENYERQKGAGTNGDDHR